MIVQTIGLLLLLVLPITALVRRRLPEMKVLKMAVAWVAIFGVGLVILSLLN